MPQIYQDIILDLESRVINQMNKGLTETEAISDANDYWLTMLICDPSLN